MAVRPTSIYVNTKAEPSGDLPLDTMNGTTLASCQVSLDSLPFIEEEFKSNPFIDPKVAASYRTFDGRFSPFNTNLLSIPSELISCFTLFGITWVAERVGQRCLIASVQNLWNLPCIIALRFWPGANVNQCGTYGLITTLLSYPYCHAIIVGLASRNSGSVRTRFVCAAFYNMIVQTGNIVTSNIYKADDKPKYHGGNGVLLAMDVLAIPLFIVTKRYYVWKNRLREKKWDAMNDDR